MEELNEEVVEETTDSVEETTEENQEQPIEEVVEEIDESKFDSAGDPDVIKIDLDKAPQAKKEEDVVKANVDEKPIEEVAEQPAMEEVTNEEKVEEVKEAVEEAITESQTTGKPLPESVQKLVEFMDETGGDLNDYVNLNRDVSKMDDTDVLDEYYRMTKSHLNSEERNFLLEDTFGVDEEIDDDKTKRKKKIALKEQVAEAKAYLDGQKSKYYEEIKAGSKLTNEQQKAIDFFNRYNKESEQQKQMNDTARSAFDKKTNQVFNDKFKGFDFNVGDKKYRFNVKNANEVKSTQSDINNFVTKFTDDKGIMTDAQAYHKSLFTAMNADAVAQHFYEQGRADAIKERVAKDKNIQTEPRKTHGEVNVGGMKIRALGDSSDGLKLKIKKRK